MQNVAEILLDNGTPFKVHNMEIDHRFNLGDSVFVTLDSYNLDSLMAEGRDCIVRSVIQGLPFYVCGLVRDCDGSPLYDVSLVNLVGDIAHLERYIINSTKLIGVKERLAVAQLAKMITLRAISGSALSKAIASKD
ncbi:hypothetical protein QTV49_000464 [Vibrio vulnificus]|nr:hypothetical protein [Vibrio vulnificus]